MDAARRTAAAYHIPVCDCYARWKKAGGGPVPTRPTCSPISSIIRRRGYGLFAMSLLQNIFFGADIPA